MKKNILFIILFLTAVSCGKTNGTAPNTSSDDSTSGSCAGDLVGGYCWYQGNANESCTNVCSTHGGYNAATGTYAGDAGTDQQCVDVLDGLGAGVGAISTNNCLGATLGCMYLSANPFTRVRCNDAGSTTEGTSNASYRRACACNE